MTPSTQPPPRRLIRLPEVQARVSLKTSAIYARIRAHTFPAPVKLGPKASAWVEHEIEAWIAKLENDRGQPLP